MKENRVKKSIEEANILRGILCIFVLIIHTTANPSIELKPLTISSILFSIANTSTKLAVPGFIFISGLTLAYSYKDRKINNTYLFYKNRFKNIVVPYIMWTLIYYLVYIKLYNYKISLRFLLERLINGSMSYHLYFIIIIIQFYIFFPMILKTFKRYNNKLIMIVSILLNIIIVYSGFSYIFFGKYISYFILGMYLAFNYKNIIILFSNIKNKIIIFSMGILVNIYYIIEVYLMTHFKITLNTAVITYYVFCFISILMYYILSIEICKSKNNVCLMFKRNIKKLSKVSFSIYFVHPLLILIIERVLKGLSISFRYGIMTVLLIVISFVYANLSYKNKLALNFKKC